MSFSFEDEHKRKLKQESNDSAPQRSGELSAEQVAEQAQKNLSDMVNSRVFSMMTNREVRMRWYKALLDEKVNEKSPKDQKLHDAKISLLQAAYNYIENNNPNTQNAYLQAKAAYQAEDQRSSSSAMGWIRKKASAANTEKVIEQTDKFIDYLAKGEKSNPIVLKEYNNQIQALAASKQKKGQESK